MDASLLHQLSALPRPLKRFIQIVFDLFALAFSAWLSYRLRIGPDFAPNLSQWIFIGIAPLVAIPFFIRLGLYRAILRYLADKFLWTIVQAMSLATITWVLLIFLAEMTGGEGVPRSIPVIYWAIGISIIGGSRFLVKAIMVRSMMIADEGRRALIYGAGRAGTQLAAALRAGGETVAVGFVDDDKHMHGQDVAGLRVFSPDGLAALIDQLEITDVILCIPSAAANVRLTLAAELAQYDVKLMILPAISEIAAGKYSFGTLKEIDVEDLLGRSPVAADPALIQSIITHKAVMITGAGGSIGSELCRLVVKNEPNKVILVESSELALYDVHRALARDFSDLEIVPVLASVIDDSSIKAIFKAHQIDVVFHAAAYKHVPLLEQNPIVGVRNNVLGTYCVARHAFEAKVKHFVLISSDKAVFPSSVMGATKRWSELIVRHFADLAVSRGTGQRFLLVRFGNVLGSNGSVVPLFKEQLANGGPLTITDDGMTRYFMAIPEAAELIVQAAALSQGGETFLLDMGEPISIRTLAKNMVRLSGRTIRDKDNPEGDIEIKTVGIRAGEKLHESLYYDPKASVKTAHPKIHKAKRRDHRADDVPQELKELKQDLKSGDVARVRARLFNFISET